MFVTVKPLRWEGEEFTIAIKLLMKVVEGGKTRTSEGKGGREVKREGGREGKRERGREAGK